MTGEKGDNNNIKLQEGLGLSVLHAHKLEVNTLYVFALVAVLIDMTVLARCVSYSFLYLCFSVVSGNTKLGIFS